MVWQTNPLYKGLSFRTSPNFPLLLHTEKPGWLCYYSRESMYYIQTSVFLHWCIHCYFWLVLNSTGLDPLFSILISYKLVIRREITLTCDLVNRHQCIPVVLSRLLCQVQTRATHSQSSHFADWMTRKWKWKNTSTYKSEVHLLSVMLDQKWSIITMSIDVVDQL